MNADGAGVGFSGQALTPAGSTNPYPFDINDPAAVAAALEEFALLDPSDPEYQGYLDGFAAAIQAGELDTTTANSIGATMGAQGLIYDSESLSWISDPQITIADNVASLLTEGTTWSSLTQEQRTAYANVYPAQAVATGGVGALNVM